MSLSSCSQHSDVMWLKMMMSVYYYYYLFISWQQQRQLLDTSTPSIRNLTHFDLEEEDHEEDTTEVGSCTGWLLCMFMYVDDEEEGDEVK